MRLSDAILIGRNLVTQKQYALAKDEAEAHGCALTMAGRAIGGIGMDEAFARWDWLDSLGAGHHGDRIAAMFDEEVMKGRMTLEQLVDYVRSIEPAEEEYIPDPRDEEPWSDTQTRLEQMNSIKGR